MPVSAQEKAAYQREVKKWIKTSKNLDKDVRKALQAEAEIVRKAVADAARELKKATALTTVEIDALKQTIANAMATYTDNAIQIMEVGVGSTVEGGFASVASGIQQLEVLPAAVVGFNPEMTAIATQYSADLIRGISEETLRRINTELRLAQLANVTPFEAMQKIDTVLGTGMTNGVSAKAERIVRTELTRSFSIGQKMGLDGIADAVGEDADKLKKEWVSAHAPNSRETHTEADGQKVKWDEDFIVGNEALAYPGDPKGSPGNTINCLCRMVPYVDDLIDSEIEKAG